MMQAPIRNRMSWSVSRRWDREFAGDGLPGGHRGWEVLTPQCRAERSRV